MAQIVLHNLSKRYGRGSRSVLALHDVNLSIDHGELLAIVGPSGCGKTTLLRLIAGLEQPTSGEIHIAGRNVAGVQPRDRGVLDGRNGGAARGSGAGGVGGIVGGVAMVFQDFPLYPHMTVRKNLAFPLKNRKTPRAEIDKRVNEIATLLGLSGAQLDRYPRELSGGERQRVALGRGLVVRPACLLLDEPLSNLDARLRATLRCEIKAIHQRLKTTIVHVTHDQDEAMMLGDRIAVMNAGRIEQVGTPMEVYRRPITRFVAEFMGGWGGGAMNFIDGMIAEEDGVLLFQCGEGEGGEGGDELRLPLSDLQAVALKDHLARDVTLGVRPADVRLCKDGVSQAAWRINVEIAMIEPLGDQMNVHVRIIDGAKQSMLTCRMRMRDQLKVGDRVMMTIEAADAHFFEKGSSGKRVGI